VARCLSVTRRYYIKTAKHIIKRFSPLDSCKILVLRTKRYGNTWTRTIQDTVINLLGRPTLVHSSVSYSERLGMLHAESLELRRLKSDLTLIYRIVHGLSALDF